MPARMPARMSARMSVPHLSMQTARSDHAPSTARPGIHQRTARAAPLLPASHCHILVLNSILVIMTQMGSSSGDRCLLSRTEQLDLVVHAASRAVLAIEA